MFVTVHVPARSESIQGVLAAMAIFVVNDTLVKIAAGSLPTGQTLFVRGVCITAISWMLIIGSSHRVMLGPAVSLAVLARALADLGATAFFYPGAGQHAGRRGVWHFAIYTARHHGCCRAVPASQGWLAQMVGDGRGFDWRPAHHPTGLPLPSTPMPYLPSSPSYARLPLTPSPVAWRPW
jgi:hypothetical protein